eukprot:CAMPEP_0168783942 /NCGR_PEP_ID=MMETSP0725-20121227/9958_1 /TAXON_ID=265536 /ORGANISM="Amphiprora sp., Strain CCMP467" /LENGTH=100 /DNA_ID=CAMNT_0008833959 /DNA_START=100 /DNA_END=402 /DNA_ORIENTATION=-
MSLQRAQLSCRATFITALLLMSLLSSQAWKPIHVGPALHNPTSASASSSWAMKLRQQQRPKDQQQQHKPSRPSTSSTNNQGDGEAVVDEIWVALSHPVRM